MATLTVTYPDSKQALLAQVLSEFNAKYGKSLTGAQLAELVLRRFVVGWRRDQRKLQADTTVETAINDAHALAESEQAAVDAAGDDAASGWSEP